LEISGAPPIGIEEDNKVQGGLFNEKRFNLIHVFYYTNFRNNILKLSLAYTSFEDRGYH
jgi:hypothetical protein